MKKGKGFLIACIVFIILSIITSLSSAGIFIFDFVNIFSSIIGRLNNASAIGVIGGADGPTAIFLTGKFNYLASLSIVFKICSLASFILWIIWNKKAD